MTTTLKDLTGKRFGLLLVIGQAGKNKHGLKNKQAVRFIGAISLYEVKVYVN